MPAGLDGETLEVAPVGGATGDGVTGHLAPTAGGDPEMARRRRSDGVVEATSVEGPERVEGAGVDGEDRGQVAPPGAPQTGGGIARVGNGAQIVAQEVEPLVFDEPGSQERGQLAVVEGTGEHPVHAAVEEAVGLGSDLVGARGGTLGHGAEHGDPIVAAPGRHLETGACPPPAVIDGHGGAGSAGGRRGETRAPDRTSCFCPVASRSCRCCSPLMSGSPITTPGPVIPSVRLGWVR